MCTQNPEDGSDNLVCYSLPIIPRQDFSFLKTELTSQLRWIPSNPSGIRISILPRAVVTVFAETPEMLHGRIGLNSDRENMFPTTDPSLLSPPPLFWVQDYIAQTGMEIIIHP